VANATNCFFLLNRQIFPIFILLLLISSCNQLETTSATSSKAFDRQDSSLKDMYPKVVALLASRYSNFAEFKKTVDISYYGNGKWTTNADTKNQKVKLHYKAFDSSIECILGAGIKQGDISKAQEGGFSDRLAFLFKAPYVIRNRSDLNKISRLARRRPALFGEGDVAFFDLAERSVENIITPDLAYLNEKDSSEKGYLNTFNHFTAQAFITSVFSIDKAAFVGDVHERENMQELTTGVFSVEQLNNPDNNPVDNYVDLINNYLGQQLGESLRDKYRISSETYWTAELLADYLNDIQNFYSWSFKIGMKPFSAKDELMIRFAEKINIVEEGVPYQDI
jgi:hypothetical protein